MDAELGATKSVELPHEGAMRWVREGAVSADGGTAAAVARIGPGHPCVRDGVLLPSAMIELMAQTAAAGVVLGRNGSRRVKQGVLAAIREFEVLEVVRIEGETVMEIRAVRGSAFGARCRKLYWRFGLGG